MRRYSVFLLGALGACSPPDRAGEVSTWVYALSSGQYQLQKSTLRELESLNGLTGRHLRLRRGAEVNVHLTGPSSHRGDAFDFSYSLDESGTVVPADLHSFYGASVYHGLQRAVEGLKAQGYSPRKALDVYYFPRLDHVLLGDTRRSFTDNAAFYPDGAAFLMVPGMVLSDFPLMLNEGVLSHEYGHAVVQQEVVEAVTEATDTLDFSSMNEGVADLIGYAITGKTEFMEIAFADRDVSVPRSFTSADAAALQPGAEEGGTLADPHFHGSTMARSVFEAWPGTRADKVREADRAVFLKNLLTALKTTRGAPWMWNFSNAMVKTLPPADRLKACAVLEKRMEALRKDTLCGL